MAEKWNRVSRRPQISTSVPWLGYIGELYGEYFKIHEIRIPSLTNQDFMKSKARGFFFFRGSLRDAGIVIYIIYIYMISYNKNRNNDKYKFLI